MAKGDIVSCPLYSNIQNRDWIVWIAENISLIASFLDPAVLGCGTGVHADDHPAAFSLLQLRHLTQLAGESFDWVARVMDVRIIKMT